MRSTVNQSTRQETSDESYRRRPTGCALRILEAIRREPRSVDELMRDLDLSHSTCSARVNELMRDRWIHDARIRTITASGRRAIVWVAGAGDTAPKINATRAELESRIGRVISMIDGGCSDTAAIRLELAGGHE